MPWGELAVIEFVISLPPCLGTVPLATTSPPSLGLPSFLHDGRNSRLIISGGGGVDAPHQHCRGHRKQTGHVDLS